MLDIPGLYDEKENILSIIKQLSLPCYDLSYPCYGILTR